jgi:hypothetical protein
MDPSLHQSLFDSALCSPYAWRHKGLQLLQSGIVILEKSAAAQPIAEALLSSGQTEFSAEERAPLYEYQLYDIGFFLVALAIENLLKGLWVGRNPERINQITKMQTDLPEITTHQLVKVAKAAGMILSVEEESLLDDLSKIILWYGRYSAPSNVNDYKSHFASGPPSNRFLTGESMLSMDLPCPPELNHFIKRVFDELQTVL